jgi:hypothetical protein
MKEELAEDKTEIERIDKVEIEETEMDLVIIRKTERT